MVGLCPIPVHSSLAFCAYPPAYPTRISINVSLCLTCKCTRPQCPVVSFGKDARGEAVYTPGVICTTTWRVCCLCPQCGGQQYQQRDEGAVAAAAATSVSSGDGGGSSGHCGTPPAGLPIITGSYNLEEAVAAAAAGSREVGRNPPGAWFTGPEWQRHCGAASTKAWQRSTKLVAAVGGAQQLLQVPAAAGTSAAAAPAAASSGSKLVSMEHEIESRLRLKLVRRVNAAGSEYRTRNPAGEVEYQLMPLQEYRKGRKKTGVQAGQFGVAAGAGEQTAEEPPQPLLVTQARARTSAGSRRPSSLPSNSAAAGGNKGASCSSSGGKAAETAATVASAAVAGAAVPQCAMMPGARTFLVCRVIARVSCAVFAVCACVRVCVCVCV